MSRVIFIIPSENTNPESRFIGRGLEWETGWRFKRDCTLAYKKCNNELERNQEIMYLQLDKVCYTTIPPDQGFLVIWINIWRVRRGSIGQNDMLNYIKKKVKEIINKVIELNNHIDEIKIAYHQDMINCLPDDFFPMSARYSLAKDNEGQFKKIIKRNHEGVYLNNGASFNDIYECFFLNLPKKSAIIKHRLLHLFLPLDIDIQGLIESGFNNNYLGEIKNDYKDKLFDLFDEAKKIIYMKDDSDREETLEFIKRKAKKGGGKTKKKQIDDDWRELIELIPPTKTNKFKNIYELLSCPNKDRVQEMPKVCNEFHEWYMDLEKALETLCGLIEKTNR